MFPRPITLVIKLLRTPSELARVSKGLSVFALGGGRWMCVCSPTMCYITRSNHPSDVIMSLQKFKLRSPELSARIEAITHAFPVGSRFQRLIYACLR